MIYLILPIYNERDNLKSLINGLRKLLEGHSETFRLVAVNDGSVDGSLELLKEMQGQDMIITGSIINMNIGAVFSTGLSRTLQDAKDDDVILIMESDQTSELDLIVPMIDRIRNGSQDVIVASRYLPGGKYVNFPLPRIIFSRVANWLIRSFFPIKEIKDYTIFFRAYRAGIVRRAVEYFGPFGLIQSKGFVANAELLIKLSFFTNRIDEIPFVYNYGKKKGKSKINVMRTINEYFSLIMYLKGIAQKVERLNLVKTQ